MKIAIITGASSGIGQEFAYQLDLLLHKIDEIWLIARRKEQLEQLSENLSHKTRILDLDLTSEQDLSSFHTLLQQTKPEIHMLINCAGFGVLGTFSTISLKEQTGMITLNCNALTEITYECLPFMKKNSRILQLASSAAFMPQAGFAVYAASKAYVLSFSRALSEELREKNIIVTAVCPGPVDTGFFEIAEKYGKTLETKKKLMIPVDQVVKQALRDSYYKKTVSVCSLPMKLFQIAAKMLPHNLLLFLARYMK